MSDNTGGSAFPSGLIDHSMPEDALHPVSKGMTLRDYFAAKAMQGLLASPHMPEEFYYEPVAEKAYGMADAMLKARTK